MRLEQFTQRRSPATGKPYPRCQFVSSNEQCDKPTYGDGLCWKHYRKGAPSISSRTSNRRGEGK